MDKCPDCRIILLTTRPLQVCAHCGTLYCETHMIEHDKQIKMTYVTIPNLVDKK